jgi:hypothetical protein
MLFWSLHCGTKIPSQWPGIFAKTESHIGAGTLQYTFILQASKNMPKQCTTFGGSAAMSCAPRKSVGVRMPDDVICKAILEKLDEPLLCTR